MAAENHVLGNVVRIGLLYKEGILHVAGWMVSSEVKHGKHVLVVIHLRTLEQGKAHAAEDVDNLVLDYCQWVACTQSYRIGSTGQVDVIARRFGLFHLLLQAIDLGEGSLLQFVNLDTHLFLLVAWHIAEVGHEGVDFTLLAEILDAKLFYLFSVLCCEGIHFLQEFFNFL